MINLVTLLFCILLLWIIIIILGIIGFCCMFDHDMVHSTYLTIITMSSVSLETQPETCCQKCFLAVFSLLSIGIYLLLISVLIALMMSSFVKNATIEHN